MNFATVILNQIKCIAVVIGDYSIELVQNKPVRYVERKNNRCKATDSLSATRRKQCRMVSSSRSSI